MEIVKEELTELVRRVVSFLITLIILGIIDAVVIRLPAMEIEVYETIKIADIASAVISVIIIAIIIIFGQDIAFRTARIIPKFPEATPIINNLAILVAIVIAYRAFDALILPFLAQIEILWLYPIVFLCIAILPVYRITAELFTSSGKITDLIMGEKKTTDTGKTVVCPKCGNQVPQSKFCSRCGQELSQPVSTPAGNNCSQCGTVLKPGTKFCMNCGAEVKAEGQPQEKAVSLAKCSRCNAVLAAEDEFCPNCGAKASLSE
ncbi:MAG: zinc ribbon domain-containing protein [Bacillota bacterium]|jgi:uncharacterized OB-fold protein|nr:zinc ribbon domain-containing protein [Bacillota bacterium]